MQITFTTSARAYVAATQALSWNARHVTDDALLDMRDLAESVRENCLIGSERVGLDIDDGLLVRITRACQARVRALHVRPARGEDVQACLAFVMDASEAIYEAGAGGNHLAA